MASLRLLYRDVDRLPYLFTLRRCASRRGLDLDILRSSPATPGWADRLEQGDVDVLAENYWGLQAFRAKGVRFVTVASVVSRMTETLLATAAVKSVDDLRGKKMVVRGAGPQMFLPGLWLKDMGLDRDVQQVVVPESDGGRWGHWKKVVAGEGDACFVANLYADVARAAGLHEVPCAPYFFEGMNVTLTATESTVANRRADIQALVDSTFEASTVFRRDRAATLQLMRDECLDLLKEHFEISDDKALKRLYEILADELAEVPVPTLDGLLNAFRVVRGESSGRPQREVATYEDDVVPETFNPLLMWDLSFAREAQRSVR